MPKGNSQPYEKYDLSSSPFAQRPTQRDVAALAHENLADLKKMSESRFKETFIERRTIIVRGKSRDLVYPVARLRAIHERIKFHLNKIIQPEFLMSPRKGRSQRDNAAAHLDKCQYLTLDLRKFYPSTTRSKIRNALISQFQMHVDVAGLIARISTADDRACFGSPLTPVLMSIVHRPMFHEIAQLCDSKNLNYTVWVDDLTISGQFILGEVVAEVRKIISSHGQKSHKVRILTGNKPVFITGIGVVGANLVVKNSMDLSTKDLWENFNCALTDDEYDVAATRLLAQLGTVRQIVGKQTPRGQMLSSQMNSVRQSRRRRHKLLAKTFSNLQLTELTEEEREERHEEIASIPF